MTNSNHCNEPISRSDPRLKLPSLTFVGQPTMGCSYAIFSFLPVIPMLISIEMEGELLQLLQYVLYVTIGIWALMWNSTFNRFGKAINKTPRQSATLVDKFIYENLRPNAEQRISEILTYEFERKDETGKRQKIRGNYTTYSGVEFNKQLGSQLNYHTMPINKHLAKLGNLWPEQWCLYTKPEQFRALKMNLLKSSLWLMLLSGAALWLRATLVALDIPISDFGSQWHWAVLNSELPLLSIEGTLAQLPGVWCSLALSFALFLLALWRLQFKERL